MQSTFGASQHSFPEGAQVNCRPPAWHRLDIEIVHQWNVRVDTFIDTTNIKTCLRICCLNYWTLAQHFAILSQERWVRRILRWCPAGPHFYWEPKFPYESSVEHKVFKIHEKYHVFQLFLCSTTRNILFAAKMQNATWLSSRATISTQQHHRYRCSTIEARRYS